jgi:16S rRNA pseudouridine516 synthase
VKVLIKQGRIRVEGLNSVQDSTHIKQGLDEVYLDDEQLKYHEFRYYAFHKPSGVISAIEDEREASIRHLIPEWVIQKNLHIIGRLDKDTEGLLLLTNDGDFTHNVLSPKHHVEKEYLVELSEEITPRAISKLESGVVIPVLNDKYRTKPAIIKVISPKLIQMILTEGKFHQVKLMLEAVDNEVVYLKRIRFGKFWLNDLPKGDFLEIKKSDIL